MAYQLADLNNGPFGEVFETYSEALDVYLEVVEEGAEINLQWDVSYEDAQSFFFIVEAE